MDVIKELLRDEGREDEREKKNRMRKKERKHSLMVINEKPFVFG